MFRVSVGRFVCLIWAIAMPALAFAQAQAANGNIEGTVRDATGGVVPGVTVTLVNTDLGTTRVVVTSEQGFYRAPLLPLGAYTLTADMQGFRKHQQQGLTLSAGQTIVANIQLEVGGLELVPIEVEFRGVARPGRPHRSRSHHRRERDSQPAADIAQPLQLRLSAGQRHRLREQRVRRAAHQRQRLADAHQLSARRQHQHREGSRRPAHAAGVGSAGARGEGHHQRLRAGVRPDHRHGLQRDHAVGQQRDARLGQLPLPAQRHVGEAVLPGARPHASPTRKSTTPPARWVVRSFATSCTSSAPTSSSTAA